MKTTINESMARAGDADVEPIIVAWAKAGVFKEAARKAISISHAKGNAVTIIENGIVYSYLPDGTKTELRRLPQKARRIFTSRFIKIGKK